MLPLRDINPTRRVPYVTYVLIALNLGVFAYQLLALSPVEITTRLPDKIAGTR